MKLVTVDHFPRDVIKMQREDGVNKRTFLPVGDTSIPRIYSFCETKEEGKLYTEGKTARVVPEALERCINEELV